jgi:hypothetical protein
MADRFDRSPLASEACPVAFRVGDSKSLREAFLG